MEPGTVMCFKTTGELCIVLKSYETYNGMLSVRRPIMSHENGISQRAEDVYGFELETVEQHLRRDAQEMVLKAKIQEETIEEIEKVRKKPSLDLVN